MEVFHILIKRWSQDEDWRKPMFPKASSDIDYLIHDAEDMKHVYHSVGVFDDNNALVKEL